MGSAAAYHLATNGARVLGLDRYRPPHKLGSSHGRTRIIREAYFEHTLYVPLVQRAYSLWAQLEQKAGRKLLLTTGGLMIGPPGGVLVTGAKRSADDHKLPYKLLSAREVRQQFPAFQPTDDMVAVWEPRAGILFPELAIQSHLELAAQRGAELRFDEPVTKWEGQSTGVRVFTGSGSYHAERLLLSAGAWMSDLIPDCNLPLAIERQVLCWFAPKAHSNLFEPERCPIFAWEYAPGRLFYGFPDLGDGVKAGIHHDGQTTNPENLNREVLDEDSAAVKAILERFVPNAAGSLLSAEVCMYTNAPDAHFIFGWHPTCPQVLIASPCSGHGFKFSSVIGEMAAQFLADQVPPFDLSLFSPKRFGE
jgi:sarcosine oxidase